jgi:hypothetical protein
MTGQPEPAERGRYAVYEEADGGLVIPRSTGLCETCLTCGCGEPGEELRIPANAVPALRAYATEGVAGLMRMMRQGGGFGAIKAMRKL